MSIASLLLRFNQRMSTLRKSWRHASLLEVTIGCVVHFLIVVFRSICPLCCLFLALQIASLVQPTLLPVFTTSLPATVRAPLTLWCAVEFGFFFYLWHRSRVLQKRRAPPPLSKEYREIFIRRVLIAICMVAQEDEKSALVGDDAMIARAKQYAKQSPPTSSAAISSLSSPSAHSPASPGSPTAPFSTSVLPAPGPLLPALTRQAVHHRRFSLSERAFDIRRILQGWFFNAPLDAIHEENLVQWLCFGLFHRDEGEMSEVERREMRQLWAFLKRGGRSKEELEQARMEEENRLYYPSHPGINRVVSAVPVLGGRPTAAVTGHTPPPAMHRSYSDASDVEAAALRDALPPPVSVHIQPGFNSDTRCMRLIIDPFYYQHRPLALYGFVYAAHALYGLYLKSSGYRYYSSPSLKYFHRPPLDPSAPVKSTIVFSHGISNGVSSYFRFVHRLNHSGNRHVFLLVLPFISMNIVERVPTAKDTVEALKAALIDRTSPPPDASPSAPPPKVVFIGHSYGSLLASWFVKSYPDMLLSVVLVDPICFLLFTPHLCFNFLYRPPVTVMHHMLNFFVARELFIAHTLHRHFFWTVNVLWVEDLTHIGEEAAPAPEQREERQRGENWQQSDTPDGEQQTAEADGGGKRAQHNDGLHKRKLSLPAASHQSVDDCDRNDDTSHTAPSKSTRPIVAAPEILQNAVLSPLLRSPCTLARLPPASKHPAVPAPSKCYVFLSEMDDIIYAPPVYHYLKEATQRMMSTQLERRWRERGRPESKRADKEAIVSRLCDGVCQPRADGGDAGGGRGGRAAGG
ncbi:hypothetical protein MMC34_008308 [Xylographa carneopallida]|nr:hypothetical protein [Xylographa carneopallida]